MVKVPVLEFRSVILPDDLMMRTVGARPVEQVSIAGVSFKSLVDSGSQISTVSEDLYYERLKPNGVSLIDIDWLQVSAANGSAVPYIGLIVVDIVVDGTDTVKDRGILVVKGTAQTREARERVPGLLGMNILREIPKYHHLAPPDPTFDQKAGFVRVAGTQTIMLPPCSMSEIQVLIPRCGPTAVVEPLTGMVRGGARVATGFVETSEGRTTVQITNFTEKALEIPPRTRVAVVSPADIVAGQNVDSQSDELSTRHAYVEEECVQSECIEQIDLSGLSGSKWLEETRRVLRKHQEVFDTRRLGCTPSIKHKVMTVDNLPVAQAYRRLPPQQWREVRDHLHKLLTEGIIRESKSNYAAPIVVVRKKSGSIRMCCDYRRLNMKVQRDVFPLPRVGETLELMAGSKIFSTIDLASAYHQVEVEEQDKPKTAFTTPFGLYEWNRMPFGLANAPATFMRLMSSIFRAIY